MVQSCYLRLCSGLKTVSCLWSVTTDDKDGHGLKFEKVGLQCHACNVTKKISWLELPDEIRLLSSS